jgi:heptosyltransferase-2
MTDKAALPMAPREVAFDCAFFLGDRPCIWHKQSGVLCTCDHYKKVDERILIVKLDAMGDVLRSTALLGPLAEVHPHAAISWLTRLESVPLLERNPYVAEVLSLGPEALIHLQVRTFDRVINLDASRTSAGLASAARAARKDGYVLDERGVVQPTNAAAWAWLEAGIFDDIKRQGAATYQDRMAAILGLGGREHRYVLELGPDEIGRARAHLESIGLDVNRPIIGLNHGAGGRWPLKQWREEGYLELMARLGQGGWRSPPGSTRTLPSTTTLSIHFRGTRSMAQSALSCSRTRTSARTSSTKPCDSAAHQPATASSPSTS